MKTIVLRNSNGTEVELCPVGARVMRLVVNGLDVVQGYDCAEDYLPEVHESDFGATIGRYANRIAGGRFRIDGKEYRLPINNGPNTLHGGPRGWQYAVFEVAEQDRQHACLTHHSPDGDNGFPGNVDVRVDFSLRDDDSLRIDYHATTDHATPLNLTNHSYFNLSGQLDTSIADHVLWIDAYRYSPTDNTAIPLAKHRSVEGTPFDFRLPKAIGRDIEADDEQLCIGHGYDHNFVLNHPFGPDVPNMVASLFCPRSGIQMLVFTNAPGMQLYTGNFLHGQQGKGGVCYPRRSAVCLETQQYPDSPNRHWRESTGILRPGTPFHSITIFQFDHHTV